MPGQQGLSEDIDGATKLIDEEIAHAISETTGSGVTQWALMTAFATLLSVTFVAGADGSWWRPLYCAVAFITAVDLGKRVALTAGFRWFALMRGPQRGRARFDTLERAFGCWLPCRAAAIASAAFSAVICGAAVARGELPLVTSVVGLALFTVIGLSSLSFELLLRLDLVIPVGGRTGRCEHCKELHSASPLAVALRTVSLVRVIFMLLASGFVGSAMWSVIRSPSRYHDLKVGALIAATMWVLTKLIHASRPQATLAALVQLRRRLRLAEVKPREAKAEVELLILGSTTTTLLQQRLAPLMDALREVIESLQGMTADLEAIAAICERRKVGARSRKGKAEMTLIAERMQASMQRHALLVEQKVGPTASSFRRAVVAAKHADGDQEEVTKLTARVDEALERVKAEKAEHQRKAAALSKVMKKRHPSPTKAAATER